ncbi:reverse transcriptase domain, reverse transcriptase zinc-binding domain protein, partial [Tanacetum coccineum]
VCSLKDMLSNRDIARSGFSLDDSVSNLISDGAWRWPPDWLSRDDDLQSFSMACVWDTIRSWEDMVQWYNVVWFPHCILHHAIHMWLVVQQKLKTQDRLQQWDVHVLCGMDSISPQLADVIAFIIPISKGKTVISILSRIVVATTSYYIWLERNGRLFKKKTSSPDQIVQEEDFISGSNCSSYSNGAVEAGHFQV